MEVALRGVPLPPAAPGAVGVPLFDSLKAQVGTPAGFALLRVMG